VLREKQAVSLRHLTLVPQHRNLSNKQILLGNASLKDGILSGIDFENGRPDNCDRVTAAFDCSSVGDGTNALRQTKYDHVVVLLGCCRRYSHAPTSIRMLIALFTKI
jgi:hypothetical protein